VPDDLTALTRYQALARSWDSRFRIPGTPVRFGWDALLGLVPGFGDLAGGVVGAIGLWTGWRLGAPPAVLLRMLLNVGIDVLVGSIPLLGDAFDIGWRSNSRNVVLLERWLDQPHQTERRSRALLVALLLAPLVAGGIAVWCVVWVVRRMV